MALSYTLWSTLLVALFACVAASPPHQAAEACDTDLNDCEVTDISALLQTGRGSMHIDVGDRTSKQPISMSTAEIQAKLKQKQGMNANLQASKEMLDQFSSTSSWFWTYALEPSPKARVWGKENGKEFVPLINLKRVLPKKYGRCTFADGKCSVDMLVKVLKKTKKRITTRYLMGFNEPYASHQQASSYGSKAKKGVNGTEGAHWWRLWIQPAAERTGLKLVSPTTGISKQKSGWMIEFLQACYDNRNSVPSCNVEKIKTYSVHEYKCYAGYWRKYAANDGGNNVLVKDKSCSGWFKPKNEINFYTQMKTAMRQRYGDETANTFWDPYFDSVKLWVTETNCNGDLDWDKLNKNKPNLPKSPTAEQSCERITGQSCQHQEGSVAAFLGMDNIERFSWFTLAPNPPKKHPNYESIMAAAIMDAQTGAARPVGRALLNALDPIQANCNSA